MIDALDAPEASRDAARYRFTLFIGMTVSLVIFAIGSAVQPELLNFPDNEVPIWERLAANATAITVLVVGTWFIPVYRLSWAVRVVALVGLCLVAGATRALAQLILEVQSRDALGPVFLDMIGPAITTVFSVGIGLGLAEYQHIVRLQAREGSRHALVAATALEALRTEELRVRRQVAEGLHGTVQQKLVTLQTHLQRTADKLETDNPREGEIARDLEWVATGLDQLRDRDVRDLSRALYPTGIDLGLAQAARTLIRSLPPSIEVATRIDPSVIAADEPGRHAIPIETRLLAIRVLEEALANSLRHGHAARIQVELSVDADHLLHLTVDDDGTGIASEDRSGLHVLGGRLREQGGSLALTDSPLGGARLAARLPLPNQS